MAGFFQKVTSSLGNLATNVVSAGTGLIGGVAAAAGGLVGSVTPLVTNTLNSSSLTALGQNTSLSGLVGGGSTPTGSILGGLLGGGSSPTSAVKIGFFSKLFNYYKLDATTPIKTDSRGNESFNYEGGVKTLNVMKIVGHVALFSGIGFGLYKLFKKKGKW